VSADAGYDDREQIKACVDAGITPYVPLADKEAQTRQEGRFVRSEFIFDADNDGYRCPAGNHLNRQGVLKKGDKLFWGYTSKVSVCAQCQLSQKCLPTKNRYRKIYRWEHERIIDEHKQRMKQAGREHMKTRAALAEHPFGTMKVSMGWQHFLMRGLDKVRAEMNLQVFTYNFKRVLNLLGIDAFKNHLNRRIMEY
jgi:hypothetical protein